MHRINDILDNISPDQILDSLQGLLADFQGEEVEGDDASARAFFDQAEALGFPWRDLAGACGVDVDELS